MEESEDVKSEETKPELLEQGEHKEQDPDDGEDKEQGPEESEPDRKLSEGVDSIIYHPEDENKDVEEDSEFFAEKKVVPQMVTGEYMPEHDDVSPQVTSNNIGDDTMEEENKRKLETASEGGMSGKMRVTISETSEKSMEKEKEQVADGDDESEQKMIEKTAELAADGSGIVPKERVSYMTTATQKSVTISETSSFSKKPKQRKSTKSQMRERSLVYDLKPRFRLEEEDLRRPSGDFGLAPEVDAVDSSTKYYVYMDDEAEEEEDVGVEEEEEIERIDRGPYYVKHLTLNIEIRNEKIRSCILQKKLSLFFKRRNMAHVLRETDQQYDTQIKYGKKLDTYGELVEIDRTQRNAIAQELNVLKEKREQKFKELTKLFNDMQEREKEIGNGLINKKTGNPIPDKVIERLIRRQKVQMEEVSSMRLKYLQLKEMVAEKESAIEALDKIGEGLHLMDYEQLKVENRSHADKIEEKEEELTRLRFKCQNTIQILAHIREKSSALDSDIDDIREDLSTTEIQSLQVRAQLNGAKQERDHYRLMTNKLREESGLLTEPELLRDMESSMKELKTLSVELENLKEENTKKAQQIRNIRRNLEFTADDTGLRKKSIKEIVPKSVSKQHLYKGRPSLCMPTLPHDAFDYLKDFRPKVRMMKNKKK
ncbi:uncharacterized protein [Leptinotarsa decemlineata]|uniref:uncharacterized protein n=1 Tax=Leptinotarsa decemlineata TaxID=7539 RepID=UPI003D30CB85